MLTSASIGRYFEDGLKRSLARAVMVSSALRALWAGITTFAVAACCAFALVAVDAEARSRCGEHREQGGFGQSGALFAMDHPEGQSRFLYRVARDPGGYRVVVVAREGAWLGDTWERDAEGRLRHVTDICR